MKAVLAVMFVVIGSVYSATVPLKPSDVESLGGKPVPLVRKARQFGKGLYNN